MIDIDSEDLKLLTRASPDVPGHPHISTLIRWATRGVKGIKLETVVVGGRRFTSREAIRRFIAERNRTGATAEESTSDKRQREIALAQRRLDAERVK